MADPAPSEVLESLTTSKQRLVEFSNRLTAASKWDDAQAAIEWAKQIDGMLAALSCGNGAALPSPVRNSEISAGSPRHRRDRLPYYYVKDNRLVKVGPSRDGGTYEHRVTPQDFDLVIGQLIDMAVNSTEFETQRLVDRCDVPSHEPLLVVAVLEKYGLLSRIRRGRWQFDDAASFGDRAKTVWQRLPRQ